jgi:metallo-beta-lactamase family protein
MDITLRSEGGAEEVTGSKHILEIDGKRFLVDCGAFQGKRDLAEVKNKALVRDPEALAGVILTHAHFDHCGMLPLLAKRGYAGNVYSTPATRDLANLVMMDSAKIQARDAEYLGKQAARKGLVSTFAPLYDDKDALKATSLFVTVDYHREILIGEGVGVEFFDAGHILGSALARVRLRDAGGAETVIGFTGDLGRKNKPIIRDPEALPRLDYLVLESTYGDRLHEADADAMERLADIVSRTVARGGKVVIPAFAIERTQEIIFHLHLLCDRKKIPPVPIWVDSPMATDATSIFRVHPECYDAETAQAFLDHHDNPFGFANLNFSVSVEQSKRLNDLKGPAIIISADGMCEAGRIQHHLMHTIGDPANTILIVGYMAENTLGRRIRDGAKEVRIHGDFFPVRADVQEIGSFSAHADYAEVWEWLSSMDLSGLKRVFLVHGEKKALEHQKSYLESRGIGDVVIVRAGESYPL